MKPKKFKFHYGKNFQHKNVLKKNKALVWSPDLSLQNTKPMQLIQMDNDHFSLNLCMQIHFLRALKGLQYNDAGLSFDSSPL